MAEDLGFYCGFTKSRILDSFTHLQKNGKLMPLAAMLSVPLNIPKELYCEEVS